MWQVEVVIPGFGRGIVGPFPDDQEDDARAVASAWYAAAIAADGLPGIGDFKVDVQLKRYVPMLPNADVDWLYSRYVKPNLPTHGT